MGRKAKPWYRASHRRWYATVHGQQVGLPITDPNDLEGALRAWGKIRAAEGVGGLKYDTLLLIAKVFEVATPTTTSHPETVHQLVPAYEAASRKRLESDASKRQYTRYLKWLRERFGDRSPSTLMPDEVTDAVREMKWANNTQRMCIAIVGKFVRWCGVTGFKLKSPPAESRGAEVVLTDEEFDRLLASATGDYAPLLRFERLSWCRPVEARTLTVEAVDWVHGTITMKKHKTKRKGRQRILFLCPDGLAVLQGQKDKYGTGPLFRDVHGKMFGAQAVMARMRRLRRKAGVREDAINYSCRHTGATRALETGEPDSDVAAVLGHANTNMIHLHYSHIAANARRLKAMVARVNDKRAS